MFRKIAFGAVVAMGSIALAAPDAKDDLSAAAKKLSDASNYSWKTTMESGQFKRVLNAVYDFAMSWNAVASKAEQTLAARAAIEGAGWCLLTSVAIRELLGVPPKFSSRDFANIVERIAVRT